MAFRFRLFVERFPAWPLGHTYISECLHIGTKGEEQRAKGEEQRAKCKAEGAAFYRLALRSSPLALCYFTSSNLSFACAIIQRSFTKSSRVISSRDRSKNPPSTAAATPPVICLKTIISKSPLVR